MPKRKKAARSPAVQRKIKFKKKTYKKELRNYKSPQYVQWRKDVKERDG